MNQVRFLVIGAGKWFCKTHLNSIKSFNPLSVQLSGVADILERSDDKIRDLLDFQHVTDYIKLTGDINLDKKKLCDYIQQHNITCIIISSPPITHLQYINIALENSVDIICDKPIFAYANQSVPSEDIYDLTCAVRTLSNIQNKIKESIHRCFNRKCYFFVPLRRRVQNLYSHIYSSIDKIRSQYDQSINHVNIVFNDGCYRLNNEYNMKGAHSYIKGIGILTQTGYHWIDFIARLITIGCGEIQKITTQVTYCRTVGDYAKEGEDKKIAKILNSKLITEQIDISALDSEIDINLQYTIHSKQSPICEITLSLQHSGCTNRTIANYDKNATHDEGRTDDCFVGIQQGALQSFYVTFSADSSEYGPRGKAMLWHRTHPNVTNEVGVPSKEEYQISLDKEIPAKDIVKSLIEVIAGFKQIGSYQCLSIHEQTITTILYVSSIMAKKTNKLIEYTMESEEFSY